MAISLKKLPNAEIFFRLPKHSLRNMLLIHAGMITSARHWTIFGSASVLSPGRGGWFHLLMPKTGAGRMGIVGGLQ